MNVVETPDFLHLPAPIAALFTRAAERSFFALPIWYHVLSRHGTDKDTTARIYLDNAASPHAALLCQQQGTPRRLVSLANFYTTEHGPIHAANEPQLADALAEIAHGIASEKPGWQSLQLTGLDPAATAYPLLIAGFRHAGWRVFPYFDSGTWYEDTAGVDFAQYLAGRPSTLRNTWRRRSAKLEADKRASFVFHEDVTAIESGIADYEAIYRTSWKGGEPYPDFTPALIRAAAAVGALRLGILRVDDRPAAAQIWLVWRGHATIYKLAHDSHFDDLSVGTILTMRMFERVLERDRPAEINFGRGDDPYKKLWLTKRRERWGLLMTNPRTLTGLFLTIRENIAALLRRWRPAKANG